MTKEFVNLLSILTFLLGLVSCGSVEDESSKDQENDVVASEKPLEFESYRASDSAKLWWARSLADVDNDGILDVVLINNNGYGGWMGYLKGRTDGRPWETIIVAEQTPNGKPFASGDLEVGDLDGDGDIDLVGVEHPGEWQNAGAKAMLFWYEQTADEWEVHSIGVIPSALKDMSIRDLDGDDVPEIVTVTFDAETISLFRRAGSKDYTKVWERKITNLHEGLDVGDVDGDGLPDIAANGYLLSNPGILNEEWQLSVIDSIWMNQTGDWSRNATKVVCIDFDGDGVDEVFMSHSERGGYPIAMYKKTDAGYTKTTILDSLPAAHSLIVVDMDLDGNYDVVTGVNRSRARDIGKTEYPVYVIREIDGTWEPMLINSDGVYNMLGGDIDGDGDTDLVRLTTHDSNEMDVMLNKIK